MIDTAIVLVIAISSVWVYVDATNNKIGKVPEQSGMFNMNAGAWALVTLLLWIVGFPAYLAKRNRLIEAAKEHPVEVKGKAVKLVALVLVGGLWVLVTLAGSLIAPKEIGMVKYAKAEGCPNATLEQMVNSYMGAPKWSSGVSDDGATFVNITGEITYAGKPASALIQYLVDVEADTYSFNVFEVNGESQDQLTTAALFLQMCQAATGETAQTGANEPPANEPAENIPTGELGAVFKTNTFEFSVVAAKTQDVIGNIAFAENAGEGATYVIVDWYYKNISNSPVNAFSVPKLILVAPDGTQYEKDMAASALADSQGQAKAFSNVNPHIKISAREAFHVSKELYQVGGWKALVVSDEGDAAFNL